MPVITEPCELAQLRVSEEFCREIVKLDLPARLYAMKMITDSIESSETTTDSPPIPHLTDLRGMGNKNWGSKEEIDTFIRKERESWD